LLGKKTNLKSKTEKGSCWGNVEKTDKQGGDDLLKGGGDGLVKTTKGGGGK